MKRIHFLQNLSMAFFGVSTLGFAGQNMGKNHLKSKNVNKKTIKLSLAQWSLNKSINGGVLDPYDFAKVASEYGFSGLEYVTQLYKEIYSKTDKTKAIETFVKKSLHESQKYGLENVLIMVDDEGDLSIDNQSERLLSIENHKRWVDAAAQMGCHSIRVNLYGTTKIDRWKDVSKESLLKLSEYASSSKINILVENHGGLSSNAKLLMEVINDINLPNCRTLPDFGNFCIEKKGDECIYEYDKYVGVEELLSKPGAVSAKSYDFDNQGNETTIDYQRMLDMVNKSGYTGYIGVEYEGNRLSEKDGILATKKLIEKFT
ncbi:MAG: sugar phosphate isomerase/epimerase [Flavobacteriaceae bacterium]|jgi:sugar phosphate isomerase/epimerase|nr:sugar phosphate isomerase/epimerase [Flavobacteriaceae bacterium]